MVIALRQSVLRPIVLAIATVAALAPDALGDDGRALEPFLSWEELPDPDPTRRLSSAFLGASGGVLILAGGRYDPSREEEAAYSDRIYVLTDPGEGWALLDHRLPRPFAGGTTVVWKNRLICLGGANNQGQYPDGFTLQIQNGKLVHADLPSLPVAASQLYAAVLNDTVYVAAVVPTGTEAGAKKFWSLDLAEEESANRWTELDSWPGPARSLAVAGVQDQAFFLFGGLRVSKEVTGERPQQLLRDGYRYSPADGWNRVADMPDNMAATAGRAVALGDSHLLTLGGLRHQDEVTMLAYDINTDTWRNLDKIPAGVSGPLRVSAPETTPARNTPSMTWWRGRLVLLTGGLSPGRLFSAEIRQAKGFGLRVLDYLSLVGYLLLMVAVGVYFSRREQSTKQFFLGGRRVPWWAAGVSLFGTQLSAITFMAIPAMVYRTNWVYFLSQLTNILVALTIVRLYLPFYRRLNLTTAYEYLERRYNVSIRLLGSGAFICFQLVRVGIILYLPALALSAVTGLDIYLCILAMGVLATFYTTLGGIEAVIWTDVLQVIVLLGGALLSLVIMLTQIPDGLTGVLSLAAAEEKLHIANLNWDITTAAVWVVVIGGYMNSLGVYSSDQTTVQRYLTTRDERAAARSIWTHVCIQIPSALLFFGLGTSLWAFFKAHPELLDPTGKTDQIFPWFIAGQLPAGLSGLVIAALFSAAMSSLDSSMNSMATAVTTDFYRRFREGVTDRHCLFIARVLTALFGVLGTCVALYTARLGSTSIWELNFEVAGLFGAGLAGIFAAGVFTRRTHATGILFGFLASGLVLYVVKHATNVHFFMYGAAGILSCVAIGWLASSVLPTVPKDLQGLTIYSLNRSATGPPYSESLKE